MAHVSIKYMNSSKQINDWKLKLKMSSMNFKSSLKAKKKIKEMKGIKTKAGIIG